MNPHIEKIRKTIEPIRQEILAHKVYAAINSIEDLNLFMQFHVYAVWDFMSLLKSLQNNLTCTSIPWFPKGSAETRHLINEIVVGEEADIDSNGEMKSHFEMYLEAMQQSGANNKAIQAFVEELQTSGDFTRAYAKADTPEAARNFVDYTFEIIASNKPYLQAAIFTFGREDLIPGMFISLINDIQKTFPDKVAQFKYYLERHIEVDGDHHSLLALKMTENLCGDNEHYWQEAENAILESLKKRAALWDGAYQLITAKEQMV